MRAGYPLRFYMNPAKVLFVLLGAFAFAALGYFIMRQDPIIGVLNLAFFGGIAIAAVVRIVFDLIFRHSFLNPILEIDAYAWRRRPFQILGGHVIAVAWQDISDVAVCERLTARGRRAYYLVVGMRGYEGSPGAISHTMNARQDHPLSRAGMLVPISSIYLRTTPAKIDGLLKRIAETCAHELQCYRVTLHRDISPL